MPISAAYEHTNLLFLSHGSPTSESAATSSYFPFFLTVRALRPHQNYISESTKRHKRFSALFTQEKAMLNTELSLLTCHGPTETCKYTDPLL